MLPDSLKRFLGGPAATNATKATKPHAMGSSVAKVAKVARARDWNEFFEERAAIMEYDGGCPRDLAEHFARIEADQLYGVMN